MERNVQQAAAVPGIDVVSTIFDRLRPRAREFKRGAYYFRKSLIAMVGLVIILSFVFIAIFAPLIAPLAPGQADPYEMPIVMGQAWAAPSAGHPFGQTQYGMDIFYGVIWGSRLSITIALEIVLTAVLIGTLAGMAAGFYGRWVDELLMRVTDVVLGIPSLILAMAIIISFGGRLDTLVLALVVVVWPTYARLARGVALSVKNNLYVEAARASGTKSGRILIRHILPNTLSPITVQASLDIGSVVLVAAGLSFIGFSFASDQTPEWGLMVQYGQRHFGGAQSDWWPVVYPGLFIFMFVLGFNMLGDGLRDVLDPRLRR